MVPALFYPRDKAPAAASLSAPLRQLMQALEGSPAAALNEQAAQTVATLQQQAAQEVARQSRRLPLLRSYAAARDLLHQAREEAARSAEHLQQGLLDKRRNASQRVADAREALLDARVQADRAHLQAAGRQALVQQQILLQEAELSLARDAYGEAMDKAQRVIDGSQVWYASADARLARLADAGILAQWQSWVEETIAWSARHRQSAMVVNKQARRLMLYDSGRLLTTFEVDLGLNPIPDKLHEGDNATPEGRYRVSEVRDSSSTRYYRAFMLNYPNEEDWQRYREAQSAGLVPEGTPIGGLIEIHGYGGRGSDWTNGCVALTNREMDFLEGWVENGTPVTIVGALPGTSLKEPPAGRASAD